MSGLSPKARKPVVAKTTVAKSNGKTTPKGNKNAAASKSVRKNAAASSSSSSSGASDSGASNAGDNSPKQQKTVQQNLMSTPVNENGLEKDFDGVPVEQIRVKAPEDGSIPTWKTAAGKVLPMVKVRVADGSFEYRPRKKKGPAKGKKYRPRANKIAQMMSGGDLTATTMPMQQQQGGTLFQHCQQLQAAQQIMSPITPSSTSSPSSASSIEPASVNSVNSDFSDTDSTSTSEMEQVAMNAAGQIFVGEEMRKFDEAMREQYELTPMDDVDSPSFPFGDMTQQPAEVLRKSDVVDYQALVHSWQMRSIGALDDTEFQMIKNSIFQNRMNRRAEQQQQQQAASPQQGLQSPQQGMQGLQSPQQGMQGFVSPQMQQQQTLGNGHMMQ